MASKAAAPRDEAREVWETEACLARARAVRNAMATAVSTLRSPDMPAGLQARARETIDAAWRALAGHTVGTEDRRRLLEAIDDAARTAHAGVAAGNHALSLLPPDLIMLLVSHAEAVGVVVEAWRRTKPGRRRSPSKWAACAELWAQATGETTKADVWEATWKGAGRDRAKALREAVAASSRP